ncbi:hypothetical protein AV530_019679 [Patagioenas fasciata monilis]|uniref:Uncharacterized protein n=1 Tax=Patagioenas fasciata monilis TaxID=372326 RepID=A0A1V4JEG7_PATFA|nr:hypothetical protein AV530_019679 [Patagioenas fasciata monilis]
MPGSVSFVSSSVSARKEKPLLSLFQSAVSSQCQLDRYSCILEKYLEQALRGVWSSNCSLLTCGDTGLYCIGKIR